MAPYWRSCIVNTQGTAIATLPVLITFKLIETTVVLSLAFVHGGDTTASTLQVLWVEFCMQGTQLSVSFAASLGRSYQLHVKESETAKHLRLFAAKSV